MTHERIFIGLGSNIGDALEVFNRACLALSETLGIVKKSRLYRTKPYGFENQADFTNAVLEVSGADSPEALLLIMQALEMQIGKKVIHKNGPRCIDLDLLFFGERILNTQELVLPHPQAHQRDFVLLPMCDVAPDYLHPILKISMQILLEQQEARYHTGIIEEWR